MGRYEQGSEYFAYECDEFDRNFLAFHPELAIITGLAWDHHEIFPTEEDYINAFEQFVNQAKQTVLWQEDAKKLNLLSNSTARAEEMANPDIEKIKLTGLYNRRDAWLVVCAVAKLTGESPGKLIELMSAFPGVSRRFEPIIEDLYTDYAHTPEKIIGAMAVAREALRPGQKIVVIYEPLTNRRMHYTRDQHQDVFAGASKIYWVPSYLAREDPDQPVLTPEELIKSLNPILQPIAEPKKLDDDLKTVINSHLTSGDLVLALSGGGADSLDEWLRQTFKN